MNTRRNFLFSGAAAGAAAALTTAERASARSIRRDLDRASVGGAQPRDHRPVIVPSGSKAPMRDVDGAKVYHLVVEEFDHTFAPGLVARCWGFNRMVNGHVIEAVEGDRVRIYVTNKLPAPTSTHWHGLILPNGMDGVSGLTQPPIPPGETWLYEFDLRQNGTHMFHSHHDTMTQEGLGLTGMFVIHPADAGEPMVDRDFALMLHEWRIDAGARRPNPNEMSDFNVLTMNGKIFPFLDPLVVRKGQRVRMRIGNLSAMDHHPIHLHGYEFHETAVDGCRIPSEQQRRRVTTLVGVGETRDIEFDAVNVGDWAFHCHMTHHVMNQMGHAFPNMIGFDPKGFDSRARSLLPGYMTMGAKGMGDMTDMGMPLPENSVPMIKAEGGFGKDVSLGGMAGVLKVREGLSDEALEANRDPGWYEHPEGTVAGPATAEDRRRDGIVE
ncbi:MAG: copper oxidase [Planctomycetes bacterium]|nr:copper oxidase [Planctomycetota bacterium]